MAAVLWQATEARAPIRSSGQMAVVNAKAQSVNVILPQLNNFGALISLEGKGYRGPFSLN